METRSSQENSDIISTRPTKKEICTFCPLLRSFRSWCQTASRFPSRRLGLISLQACLYAAALTLMTPLLDLRPDRPMTHMSLWLMWICDLLAHHFSSFHFNNLAPISVRRARYFLSSFLTLLCWNNSRFCFVRKCILAAALPPLPPLLIWCFTKISLATIDGCAVLLFPMLMFGVDLSYFALFVWAAEAKGRVLMNGGCLQKTQMKKDEGL